MEDYKTGFTVSIDDVKENSGLTTDKEISELLYEKGALKGLWNMLDEAYQTWLENIQIYTE